MHRSAVLDRLGCSYSIQSVPPDGDCFYHAFIKTHGLSLTTGELRRFVARNITDDDAVVFGALQNRHMKTKEVRAVISNTQEWADDLEISVLVRSLSDVALFIIDEDNNCVCKKGQDGARYKSTIARKSEHYYAISQADVKLSRIMSG